ncbi:MAG: hypothetical protein FJ312_10955 [SAR202 cluster bacterium]|nr:hypothetical protein [SAR202 cluster bacterium]
MTSKFHLEVLLKSWAARLYGRAYSRRSGEALLLRDFYYTVEPWVFLCLYARYVAQPDASHSGKTVVYIPHNPFGKWLVDNLEELYPNITCGQQPYPRLFRSQGGVALRSLLRGSAASVGQPRGNNPEKEEYGRDHGGRPLFRSRDGPRSAGKVAAQACLGLEVDSKKKRSDMFWLPNSKIEGDRVLVYFDRPDVPPTPQTLSTVQGRGWEVLALQRYEGQNGQVRQGQLDSELQWRQKLGLLLTAPFWLLDRPGRQRLGHWAWMRTAEASAKTAGWEHVFWSNKVRLHSSYTDVLSNGHVHQSVALERVGGLNVRTDTTFGYSEAMCEAGRASPFDTFLVWGPHMRDAFRKIDFLGITTLVTCGYPFDYMFEPARANAASVRRQLQTAGARKIVCFFDNKFHRFFHTSRFDVVVLYQKLLEQVINTAEMGLILKPKAALARTVLQSSEVQPLLERALATGRCLLLARQKDGDPIIYPCQAALAADLALGYAVNSAVVEAVLAGVPGVHIDLTREPGHPFYEHGYGKIVFDDLELAMAALRKWLTREGNPEGLGDHSPVLDLIDPFRDGRAAHRVGDYMTWLMEGFDSGLSRDEVVRSATRRYADVYGAEHVRLAPSLGRL